MAAFILCTHIIRFFSVGFTPHKAKQPLATRYEFTRENEKKRNIEGLSNDQKSQMHAYIALKKDVDCSSKENNMKVQNFTIYLYMERSYWQLLCHNNSCKNSFQKQKLCTGVEKSCACVRDIHKVRFFQL